MATFAGKYGEVTWDTDTGGTDATIIAVSNWTCEVNADIEDVTGMSASVAYRSKVAGLLDWTATVEAFHDTTGTEIPIVTGGVEAVGEKSTAAGARLELAFDVVGGAAAEMILHGSAICTGLSVNDPVDGPATVTYSFQGCGPLTYATTDPA